MYFWAGRGWALFGDTQVEKQENVERNVGELCCTTAPAVLVMLEVEEMLICYPYTLHVPRPTETMYNNNQH